MSLHLNDQLFLNELEEINGQEIISYHSEMNGRIVELILDDSRVTTIPPSISNLKHLRKLEMRWTSIGTLPKELADLPELKVLYINDQSITQLPNVLKDSSLEVLKVRSVLDSVPKWIDKLLVVNLFVKPPKDRLPPLSNLFTIEEEADRIVISKNKELDWVDKVGGLEYENAHIYTGRDQDRTKIPPVTSTSSSDNKNGKIRITEDPAKLESTEFGEHLSEISIVRCGLQQFPDDLFLSLSISKLILSGNSLRAIPASISKLSQLVYLNLAGNNIITIDPHMTQLSNLKHLNLSGNGLTKIPPVITKLTSLETLILADNNLTSLPDEMSKLKNLRELNVENNSLKFIPRWISELEHLRNIKFNGNEIDNFGNLEEFIHDLPLQSEIDLSDQNNSAFSAKFSIIGKYIQLTVDFCSANSIPSLSSLPFVTSLVACFSKLDEFPKEIFDMKSLLHLDLDGNYIKNLPHQIQRLDRLQKLSLNRNFLKTLPDNLEVLQDLKGIHLHSNNFSTFPEVLTKLPNLEFVDLTENMKDIEPLSEDNAEWLEDLEGRKGKVSLDNLW